MWKRALMLSFFMGSIILNNVQGQNENQVSSIPDLTVAPTSTL